MRKLYLKAFRDLGALRLRAVALILLVAVGIGAYSGGMMARESASYTRDSIYAALHLADFEAEFTPAAPDELPSLKDLPGVARVLLRFETGSYVNLSNGKQMASLMVFLPGTGQQGINDLRILEGRGLSPDDPNGVVVEHNLARRNHLRVGDVLMMETLGQPRELRIVGIGFSPDYLLVTVNPYLLVPAENTLALIFAPISMVSETLGYSLFNHASVLLHPGADRHVTEDALADRLAGLGVKSITPRGQAFAYRFLEWDLRGFDIFVPVTFGFIALVTFVATLLVLTRLVQSQRQEIGALRALGYRPAEVAVSFAILGLGLSALATPVGIAFGLYLRGIVVDTYAAVIGLPPIERVTSWRVILHASTVSALACMVAAVLPALRIARLSPQQAMRETISEGGFTRVGGLVRVFESLSRLGVPRLITRYAARDLARRPSLTLVTCAAIALASASGLAFRASMSSIDSLEADIAKHEHWDATIDFRVPLDPAEIARVAETPGITRVEPLLRVFGKLDLPNGAEEYVLLGVPPDMSLRDIRLDLGRTFSGPDAHEVLLSRAWGSAGMLAVGDEVRIRVPGQEMTAEVIGFLGDISVGEAMLPLSVVQGLAGKPGKASGLLVAASQPLVELRPNILRRSPDVARVFGKAEIQHAVREILGMMWALIGLAGWVQLGVAVILLFSALYLNVLEHRTDYGMLTATGWRRSAITAIVELEALWMGAVALAASVPLGLLLALVLNRAMSAAWVTIPFVFPLRDVALVLIPGFALVPIAAIPGLRSLFATDLPTLVRVKGFG